MRSFALAQSMQMISLARWKVTFDPHTRSGEVHLRPCLRLGNAEIQGYSVRGSSG